MSEPARHSRASEHATHGHVTAPSSAAPHPAHPHGHPVAGPANQNHARIVAFGMNHRTAPFALREKLSVPPEETGALLKALHAVKVVREAVAISTCNRIEVYAAIDGSHGSFDQLVQGFCETRKVPVAEADPFLARYEGFEVAKHLFTVTAGLDSMVPGENEVLSQVKSAYAAAVEAGAAGSFMGRLFQHSFKVGKEVRTTTGISRRRVSLATVVVDLTHKIFGEIKSVKLLLAGTGKMGSLALSALVDEGAKVSVIANRSMDNAQKLAECHGCRAVPLEEIGRNLAYADVYVGATASPSMVLHAKVVEESLASRKGRPLLLVDLSVPRNIEPSTGSLSGVILCNMDDLQGIVNSNVAYRLEQAGQAAELIEKAVVEFHSVMRMDRISDVITRLREVVEKVGNDELARAGGKLAGMSEAQRAELGRLVGRVTAKFLHYPLRAMRDEAEGGKTRDIESAVRKIFGL